MFLMRKTPPLLAAERGSSMLAVIGLMAVAGVATLAIAGATMNSLGVSSAARAGVQAQAAAESGIDDALAGLSQAVCVVSHGTTTPKSDVVITFNRNPTPPDGAPDDGGWFAGCPSDDAVRVKIISTGTANQFGSSGNVTGNFRTVEAIYAWQSASTATPGADRAVLYAYSMGSFSGSSKINSLTGTLPVLMVRNGDVQCSELPTAETAIFQSSIAIANGGLHANGSCQIMGSVWASDPVFTYGSAQIFGDLIAPSARLVNSSIVHGSIWTTGATALETSAWVKGSVTAGSISMINSAKIDNDAWSASETMIGDTTNLITGDLTTKSLVNRGPGTITGVTKEEGAGPEAGPAAPVAPIVPDWVDVGYDLDDWRGFSEVKMSTGCGYAEVLAAVNNFVGPGVIDARGCGTGISLQGNLAMNLPHDLVIYAQSFHLGESAQITAAAGSERNLWLITPDEDPNNEPSCVADGDTTVTESFIVQPFVSAMIYSPCAILMASSEHLVSAQWSGQFYGATVTADGTSMLNYSPVVFPGTSLSEGSIPGSDTTVARLGNRTSIRDLNG